MLDVFVFVYLDGILIYILRTQFKATSKPFDKLLEDPGQTQRVRVEDETIKVVKTWPEPKSARDIFRPAFDPGQAIIIINSGRRPLRLLLFRGIFN